MDNSYIIREAVTDDAEKMSSYLNQVNGESDNMEERTRNRENYQLNSSTLR